MKYGLLIMKAVGNCPDYRDHVIDPILAARHLDTEPSARRQRRRHRALVRAEIGAANGATV